MSSNTGRKRAGLRLLVLAVALAALGAGGWAGGQALRQPLAVQAVRRQAAREYDAARTVSLGITPGPSRTFVERWGGRWLPDAWRAGLRTWEAQLVGYKVGELTFATVGPGGGKQFVTALVLTPLSEWERNNLPGADSTRHLTPASWPGRFAQEPDAPREAGPKPAPGSDTDVTVYLPSSAALHGPALDLETLAAAATLGRAGRVMALPLPCREQRGEPWPPLGSLNLESMRTFALQTALDLARASEVCRDRGWRVAAVAGTSLGGCVAPTAVGLHPKAFAGAELFVWGGGGDLLRLARTSTHSLAARLARPPKLAERVYQARLAAIDPVSHIGRARLKAVHIVIGHDDEVVPEACATALKLAAERAGIPCELTVQRGGHPNTMGAARGLAELLQQRR